MILGTLTRRAAPALAVLTLLVTAAAAEPARDPLQRHHREPRRRPPDAPHQAGAAVTMRLSRRTTLRSARTQDPRHQARELSRRPHGPGVRGRPDGPGGDPLRALAAGLPRRVPPWAEKGAETLTTGWVDGPRGEEARMVTLRFEGGTRSVRVPADARVTQAVPGEKALLVEGSETVAQAHNRGRRETSRPTSSSSAAGAPSRPSSATADRGSGATRGTIPRRKPRPAGRASDPPDLHRGSGAGAGAPRVAKARYMLARCSPISPSTRASPPTSVPVGDLALSPRPPDGRCPLPLADPGAAAAPAPARSPISARRGRGRPGDEIRTPLGVHAGASRASTRSMRGRSATWWRSSMSTWSGDSAPIRPGLGPVWGHGERRPYPPHARAQLVERAAALFAAA